MDRITVYFRNGKTGKYVGVYDTGEKFATKAGKYKCLRCGKVITLDEDTDRLPPCPKCNGTEFVKVKTKKK